MCPMCGAWKNGGTWQFGWDTQGRPIYKCGKCGYIWK